MHARGCSPPPRLRLALALALAGSLLGPASGRAAPRVSSIDPTIDPAAQPVREPTAADVAGSPVPGDESGRVDRIDGGDSTARLIGRGFLLLPRIALQAALAPVRAGIWANERYRIHERAYALLFNDAGTMGVYPTLGLETGFGATVGARFVHRDLFGAREHVALSGAFGGRFRERISTSFQTGDRLGRLRLGLKGEYDRRSKERFHGIGNAGEDEMVPAEPLDALAGGPAIEARYRQELVRATAVADVRLAGPLHLLGSAALTDLEVSRSDEGAPIDELYRPDSLSGWSGGARHAYGEIELRWDGRRHGSRWEASALPSAGWYAGVYGGRVHRWGGGADFWRYGADLQRFLRIGPGPRVLAARAHAEAVSGTRAEVPFFELPQLGGSRMLRGYPTERFRDRIAAFGSLDYQWDLSQQLTARLFTDIGRVYAAADDLELAGLRVGYGIGLEGHTRTSFWIRSSLASSIDGGLFFNLSFEPVFEIDGRVEKR